MMKVTALTVLAACISVMGVAQAESKADDLILGVAQLGKTTDKQLVVALKKRKCTARKSVNLKGNIIYRASNQCYRLYGDPVVTFVTNATGIVVEAIINFYSGPNYENWDYYRMDLLDLYGFVHPGSFGYMFWKHGSMSITLFPKTDRNGEHKSMLVYKYEGSTDIGPSDKVRGLL